MNLLSSKKAELNTLLKLAIIFLVVLYIWQTYMMVKVGDQIISVFTRTFVDQRKLMVSMHQNTNKKLNTLTNSMVSSGHELNVKTLALGKKVHQFQHEILNDMEKVRRRRNESIYIDKTYEFLNKYQDTFVRDIYENASKKVEIINYVVLPTFDSFMRLRERLFYCLLQNNNQHLINHYKNKIAKLKLQGQEEKIRAIKKPSLLSWPITEEQLKQYNDKAFKGRYQRYDPFHGFGKYVELDGRCTTW